MSLLLPHLNQHTSSATSGSSTVTTALVQRTKILQEENDELYEILRTGETGRLKEDVRALRRVVQKLEGALRGALDACTFKQRCVDRPWLSQSLTKS